jgi:hypothetical protein
MASNFPAKVGWLYRLSDEVFLAMEWLLQHKYLQTYNGLFSEHFYGLERLKWPAQDVKAKSQWRPPTLVVHVLLPYLMLKMNKLYEKWIIHGDPAPSVGLKKTIKVAQPLVNFAWDGLNLVLNLSYAIGRTKFHSLLNWLDGSALVHITPERAEKMEAYQAKQPLAWKLAHSLLSVGLEFGAFFLQFVNWW